MLSMRVTDTLVAGQCLLLSLPVRSLANPNALNTNGSLAASHDLSIDFAYEKSTKERYEVALMSELNFHVPFVVTQHVHLTLERKYFLHVRLKNCLWKAIKLVNYAFDSGTSGFRVVSDPNRPIVDTILLSRAEVSFAFQIELADTSSSVAPLFSIEYTFPLADPSRPHSLLRFDYPLTALPEAPKQLLYRVHVQTPEFAHVAEPFAFGFTIERLPDQSSTSTENTELQYDINADPYEWVLCGVKKQRFSLAVGESKRFECRVTAVRPGFLLLPQPRLLGVSADRTLQEQRANQIHIYPATRKAVVDVGK